MQVIKDFFESIKDFFAPVWEIDLIRAFFFLLLAFGAAFLASFIARTIVRLLKLDAKLDKWGVNEGKSGTSRKFIGKIVFLIVFLIFLPKVFNELGLSEVSAPISSFADKFVEYLPNIIAALLLLFIGIFVGRIVSQVISILLAKTKIDNLTRNLGGETVVVKLSTIIGNIIYAVVIMIFLVQGLVVLDLEAISAPALSIINAIFSAIPSLLLATVVIGFGVILANIACNLLANVLVGANFDGLVEKVAPGKNFKFSLTKIVVTTIRVIIMVFIVAQGIEILGLSLLTGILTAVIAYIPMIIKSIVIAAIAFFGAMFLESFLKKSMPQAKMIPSLAKALIYTIAGFMILSQLDFATMIVNSAFVITLCALAVAFALAFGLGGKDFAKKTLDKIEPKKENKEEKKDDSAE